MSAGHSAAMSFPVGTPISLAEASAGVQQTMRAARGQATAAATSPTLTGATVPGGAAAAGYTAPTLNPASASASALASVGGISAPTVPAAYAQQQQQQVLQQQQQQQQQVLQQQQLLQQQQQQHQQAQSGVLSSILARQSHATKLAELAAAEYNRAVLDLEQATAVQLQQQQQQQVQAAMAMSPYDVAMVQAQMFGEQMRLQGGMMPGAMMMPNTGLMGLQAQQAQLQHQHQQLLLQEAQTMEALGQAKVSAGAAAAAAAAPAPTAQQPQASANATSGVEQTKPSAAAPGTTTIDSEKAGTKTRTMEGSIKTSAEEDLDAAEAVLSLMRGGVQRPSLAPGPGTATTAPPTLFVPSAQMLLQAATSESSPPNEETFTTSRTEGNAKNKKKQARRRSTTESNSSEASGDYFAASDESGGKKQKKTRSKKKPGQPRRPLSAYNIFFSEERARIIKSMEEEMGADEALDEGGDEEDPGTAPMKDDSASGPLKKRRLSLESTGKPSASSPPAPSGDEVGAVAGQKAQQILLDRRVNPAGPGRSKRLHRRTHGRIGFQDLARLIGQRWKTLPADRMDEYKRLAEIDTKRYKEDMVVWNAQQMELRKKEHQQQQS